MIQHVFQMLKLKIAKCERYSPSSGDQYVRLPPEFKIQNRMGLETKKRNLKIRHS